ncbi:hypothetical protein [Natronococcus wangiae]|uniref:hypothetical protein n=1 Tax=Natronococcus wangiae TaxID=3068275 RepID=UPI00273D2A58|nr:hypothetical protein [Natronococcus sp. AD5]
MRPPHATLVTCCCILAAIALLGGVVVSPAAGGHPPLSVCGVCGSLDGATDAGTLDVHVDENGDSRWIARVPVDAAAAETYRTDPDALEAAVDDGWYRFDVADDDARDVDASVDGRTVRVAYTVPNVASPGVGDARVFDYFYLGGTQHRYDLRADRVTIHLPGDTRAATEPLNADVDDGTVTWTNGDSGGDGDIAQKTYVPYGPAGVTGTLASWASTAVVFGPLVLEHAALAGIAPVAVLGLATVAAGRLGAGRFGTGAGIGRDVGEGGKAALEYLCGRFDRSLGRRTLVALAAGSMVAVGVAGWLAFDLSLSILLVSFWLAAAAFLPLGYALERGDAWRHFGALATLAPLASVTALAPYYVFGFGPWAAGALFLPWALGAGVVGYSLSLVGRRVAVA